MALETVGVAQTVSYGSLLEAAAVVAERLAREGCGRGNLVVAVSPSWRRGWVRSLRQ